MRNRTLGLVGTIAAIIAFSGCGYQLPRVTETEFKKQQETSLTSLVDKDNLLKHLQEGEYLVPHRAFSAYYTTVEKMSASFVFGVYQNTSGLDTSSEKEGFVQRLENLDFSKKDIAYLCTIFAKPSIIIFNDSILGFKSLFLKVVPHERFQKKIKKISRSDYRYILKTAKEVLDKTSEENHFNVLLT